MLPHKFKLFLCFNFVADDVKAAKQAKLEVDCQENCT